VLDLLQAVGAVAAGGPAGALLLTGAPGQQFDLVGHHEAGVEADAELADEALGRGLVLGALQLLDQLGGPRVGDRADELDDLVVGHADAVVAHRQGARVPVRLDLDVQVGHISTQRVVPQALQTQLVQRVGGVRDELAQEHVLVRVDRVDHHLQKLPRFHLELERLSGHDWELLLGSSSDDGNCPKHCRSTRGGRKIIVARQLSPRVRHMPSRLQPRVPLARRIGVREVLHAPTYPSMPTGR
jgi:hypothetical protein